MLLLSLSPRASVRQCNPDCTSASTTSIKERLLVFCPKKHPRSCFRAVLFAKRACCDDGGQHIVRMSHAWGSDESSVHCVEWPPPPRVSVFNNHRVSNDWLMHAVLKYDTVERKKGEGISYLVRAVRLADVC